MTKDNTQLRKPGRSIASHLEVKIDPKHPPPFASQVLIDLRLHVTTLWEKFETAEEALVTLDDELLEAVRPWLAKHQKATHLDVRMERARITQRLYVTRIAEAETCWNELKEGIEKLEKAAKKEPRIIEGRAIIEIDVELIRNVLATVQKIMECAKAQLEQARSLLKSAE